VEILFLSPPFILSVETDTTIALSAGATLIMDGAPGAPYGTIDKTGTERGESPAKLLFNTYTL
jgi:hypothetical protein